MPLRNTPPGEDPTNGARALPVTIDAPGTPPGEDGLENRAAYDAEHPEGVADGDEQGDDSIDFLALVREAEAQSELYTAQVNRKAWSQSLRAFHNEHYVGSKYTTPEWRGRSRLFVPKTRSAVRKDNAAVAASLFNTIDAINCLPGDDGDPMQRASAAIMQQLVNYRTDRASGKASLPWFLVAMGARQDAVLTGVCMTKQCWKQEFRKVGSEPISEQGEDGVYVERQRPRYTLACDRPDMLLVPSESYTLDPAADWTDPAQSAAYVILKWPMHIEEVKAKQNAPVNPWKPLSEAELTSSRQSGKFDMAAIRRAREMGIDRLDETSTGTNFQIVWVYESFIRVGGEDYTFYSVGDQHLLTDPKPVRDVYPEQNGERPLAMGYGALEAHRIYPMAAAESWQPLQTETNDLRNLMLDATKQNVMPVTKIVRGRQIDIDQVRRRSSGSSIMVTNKDDVTWENPPQMPQTAVEMTRELDLELDDLAGQQNYGSVETNNALGKTLGGLKLAAGAANAVQEFDIRLWIETWATKALSQLVRLEQYYESDATVLALCAQRAKLFQKHGISKITDELLEQEVTVRVSVGLGAGDPQQRLAKFQSAAQVVGPLLAQTKEFQSGQVEINWEEVSSEVFGAVGYKDGGARFFKDNGKPAANPTADLQTQKLQSEITKNQQTGKAAMFSGLAALAKVALGKKELEAETVDMLLGHQKDATSMGFEHGHMHNEQHLSALEHGHRHGLALAKHKHQTSQDLRNAAMQEAEQQANQGEGQGGAVPAGGGAEIGDQAGNAAASSPGMGPSGPSSATPPTPQVPPTPPTQQAPPAHSASDERLSRLEALVEKMSRPRKRRVLRDEHGRLAGVEDYE